MKWGLDFIGPIKLGSCYTINRYNLVTIDYAMKSMEVEALEINMVVITTKLIYEFIFTRFGFPFTLVNDMGVHFINVTIEIFTTHFLMKQTCSITYYPRAMTKLNPPTS